MPCYVSRRDDKEVTVAKTAFYSHPICQEHEAGPQHPEQPARLKAILDALEAPEFAALDRRSAPLSDIAALKEVHQAELVDLIYENVPQSGYAAIDGDTLISPASGEAALRAAGAVRAAVDAVMAGEADNAFCAVRPPGHHAEPGRSMGFCLFNNVVLGAERARREHGLGRVAVVDFDVHHGNGTQAAFERDGDLFFASTHQSPLYPGTGAADERGVGNIFNAPLKPNTGSQEFRDAMQSKLFPALRSFAPQLILISAGFDAHNDDPLANLCLFEADYAWVTTELCQIAAEKCSGRVVSTLEGGYDLNALASSAAAHVGALMAA
ncbi:MAG: Histone deacetylase-like amidohydrolase [Alphaproteobacteria bacterium MarineAlpha10_Bin2]|nr:MAG: Histone deacetylase-like amidohydrolase [Alphaproteobacteria bacterium MarineAlpha10_Bin2]